MKDAVAVIIVSDEYLVSNLMSDKEVGKVLINFTRTKGLFNAESIVKVASEKDLDPLILLLCIFDRFTLSSKPFGDAIDRNQLYNCMGMIH